MSFHKLISLADIETMNHRALPTDKIEDDGTVKGTTRVDHSFHNGSTDCIQRWQSADQYAYEVLHEDGIYFSTTGVQTKNACARFVYDRRQRTDIEFRNGHQKIPKGNPWARNEVEDVIEFAGQFRHTKGKMSGKKIELLMWMVFVLANVFGWYYTDEDNQGRSGERRFTKAFTLVARGNAKSFLCSIVALYTMTFSPNGNPSCYSVARNAAQAGIVFKDAKTMIKSAASLLRQKFNVMAHKLQSWGLNGLFEPMAADSQSIDGLRVALGICDELHAHHNAELMNTLISGISATTDPLIFSISTAGIQLDGVCIHERNHVRDINSNLEKVDGYFGIEFAIDDKDNWEDEKNWTKANPSLGYAVSMNKIRGEYVRAKQSAVNRKDFLTKFLNVFVNTNDSPYLDLLQMQMTCARKGLDIKDFVGRKCYIGLDLAQKIDLAALSIIFPEDDGGVSIFQRHYLPESALDAATPARYEAYVQWEEDGHLTVTAGAATDYDFIKAEILHCAKQYDLQMVGYDPYSASQFAISLEKSNIEMVEVKQGISHLSEPSKMLQSLVAQGKLNYDEDDKAFEWCCANAVCFKDINENMKVLKDKSKPHDKIDSIIATIIGMQLCELKTPTAKNPYRKRGLVTT